MKITNDEDFASSVCQKLITEYAKTARAPDNKFHVSELLQPRQAFFTRRDGTQTTEADIKMFLSGTVFHEYIQRVLGNEFSEQQIHFDDDIVGTADWNGDDLVEIKTSRKVTIPEYPQDNYVSQILKYMAMTKKLTAKILVIFFTAGRNWKGDKASVLEIKSWKVDATEKELQEELEKLKNTKANLIEATKTGDFSKLPLCYSFSCFSEYPKGKITKVCRWYNECQPSEERYNKHAEKACDELNKNKK